jgi:transcriptional regulator with XRE-family HTH domain
VSARKQRRTDPPTTATFGGRLKLLRARTLGMDSKPLTQERLARALDVSLFTVNGWERLERSDTLRTGSLFALADFFGVEPRWLAQGKGPKHAPR